MQNDLKQIGLACHNFHSANNTLPPAFLKTKDGKPGLSWRVALLQYVEQDALYKKFHLDEPWDSDHNKKLIAQMPKIYGIPGITNPGDTTTHYRVFYGNDAMFDLTKKTRLANIYDGTSNTIMIVEASDPVEWTKPEELLFEPTKPLPKLGKQSPDGFLAAMGDGSVHFMKRNAPERTIKAAITKSGGEVYDFKELTGR